MTIEKEKIDSNRNSRRKFSQSLETYMLEYFEISILFISSSRNNSIVEKCNILSLDRLSWGSDSQSFLENMNPTVPKTDSIEFLASKNWYINIMIVKNLKMEHSKLLNLIRMRKPIWQKVVNPEVRKTIMISNQCWDSTSFNHKFTHLMQMIRYILLSSSQFIVYSIER